MLLCLEVLVADPRKEATFVRRHVLPFRYLTLPWLWPGTEIHWAEGRASSHRLVPGHEDDFEPRRVF